jgi:hypothetical protein
MKFDKVTIAAGSRESEEIPRCRLHRPTLNSGLSSPCPSLRSMQRTLLKDGVDSRQPHAPRGGRSGNSRPLRPETVRAPFFCRNYA